MARSTSSAERAFTRVSTSSPCDVRAMLGAATTSNGSTLSNVEGSAPGTKIVSGLADSFHGEHPVGEKPLRQLRDESDLPERRNHGRSVRERVIERLEEELSSSEWRACSHRHPDGERRKQPPAHLCGRPDAEPKGGDVAGGERGRTTFASKLPSSPFRQGPRRKRQSR